MNNNWLRACLLNHGLTEREANKILLSKDNIISVLKDIILLLTHLNLFLYIKF